MTDSLAASCAALARWLPAAEVLTRHPDTDGSTGSGQPGSRPPWNSAAANAVTDPHEGVRRLEASLRLLVTGHTGPRRGGSDANTMAALKAIGNLGRAVDEDAAHAAARFLERWTRAIQQLPAVDEVEPARILWGVECPYCHYGMLAVGWPGVEPKTFPAGKSFSCRYRLWIHRNALSSAEIQKAYDAYCAEAKTAISHGSL